MIIFEELKKRKIIKIFDDESEDAIDDDKIMQVNVLNVIIINY